MRTRFVQGVGGTLRLTPPESARLGAPTSGTVTIKRASGLDLPTPVTDAAATITGAVLSYVLSGAQCPDPFTSGGGAISPDGRTYSSGFLYRATWRYVIDGVTYETDQLYEVRRRVLKPTLTYAEFERDLPAPIYDLMEGGPSEALDAMGDAWDDVLDDLASRGFEPDRVMDADRLRRPHRVRTLARLARSWGPQWRQFAIDRDDEYLRAIEKALGAGDWYDLAADGKQQAAETQTPTVVLTR
jgi:hypothetical protein